MLEQRKGSAPEDVAADPGSWAAYRARKYFGELDGIRAFAIAAVVWNHAVPLSMRLGYGLGVKLFFAISGFLIITLLLRERDRTGTISLSGFYARRSLRIFPIYFSVLALYAVLVLIIERGSPVGTEFFHNLPAFITFTANWFVEIDLSARVVFYFAWSLSAQEQFYTLWPIVIRYTRGRGTPVLLMLATIAAALAADWAVDARLLRDSFLPVRIIARVPVGIGVGFLGAYLLHSRRGFEAARPFVGQWWSPLVGLAMMAAQVIWLDVHELVPTLGAAILVVSRAARPGGWPARLLEHPVLRHIGMTSLGIYLLHMLALHGVRLVLPGAPAWAVFILGFSATVCVAAASYRWFEQPITMLRKRPRPAVAPVLVAAPAPANALDADRREAR